MRKYGSKQLRLVFPSVHKFLPADRHYPRLKSHSQVATSWLLPRESITAAVELSYSTYFWNPRRSSPFRWYIHHDKLGQLTFLLVAISKRRQSSSRIDSRIDTFSSRSSQIHCQREKLNAILLSISCNPSVTLRSKGLRLLSDLEFQINAQMPLPYSKQADAHRLIRDWPRGLSSQVDLVRAAPQY